MSQDLAVSEDGAATILTLNRPDRRNALSAGLVEALIEAVETAHARRATLLVLRGAGRNFSAGMDLAGLDACSDGDLLLRFVRIQRLLSMVAGSPCLTIGLAHGLTLGAGADLVAACRWRICSGDFSFRMPGLRFGLVLGTRRLAAIVGAERARSILEESQTLDAAQSLGCGFVQRIAEPEAWDGIVAEAGAKVTLPHAARVQLYAATDVGQDDADLAALVRSAGDYGLKQRILAYVAETAALRRAP